MGGSSHDAAKRVCYHTDPNGMIPPPVHARSMAVARRAFPWLVGVAVLALQERSLELVAPSSCPGVLELTAILTAIVRPDVTLGTLLAVLRVAAVVGAVSAFVALAARVTGSLPAAAATGLAVGLGPLFPFTLAPPSEAAAFAVCAAAGLLVSRRLAITPARLPPVALPGVLLLAALIVPRWTIFAAVGAGATALAVAPPHRRITRASLALGSTAAVGGIALAVLSLVRPDALPRAPDGHQMASCLALGSVAGIGAPTSDLASGLGFLLGPVVIALAVLGLYVEAWKAGRRVALVSLIVILSSLPALAVPGETRVLAAPLLVALWLLAAAGLREALAASGRGRWSRLPAAGLLLLVPVLQVAHRQGEERDDQVRPIGHARATLGQMRTVLNVVPTHAVFVEEDASFDLLLRAAVFGGRRAAKPFSVVPKERDAVRSAFGEGPVYAFPRGQQDLSSLGFVVRPAPVWRLEDDGSREAIGGLGVVTGVRPCHVLTREWVAVGDALTDGRIALVADTESARGPVILYLGGARATHAAPDGWPARTLRGFHTAAFDQRTGDRSVRLAHEAAKSGLPDTQPVLAAPFVMQLELWRTPRAPLALPVVLGAPFTVGVGKLERDTPPAGTLQLCDAPAVEAVPFGPSLAADPG
jgi:hypothetical protein